MSYTYANMMHIPEAKNDDWKTFKAKADSLGAGARETYILEVVPPNNYVTPWPQSAYNKLKKAQTDYNAGLYRLSAARGDETKVAAAMRDLAAAKTKINEAKAEWTQVKAKADKEYERRRVAAIKAGLATPASAPPIEQPMPGSGKRRERDDNDIVPSCPVCARGYDEVDPVWLECNHSLCTECLAIINKRRPAERTCVECGAKVAYRLNAAGGAEVHYSLKEAALLLARHRGGGERRNKMNSAARDSRDARLAGGANRAPQFSREEVARSRPLARRDERAVGNGGDDAKAPAAGASLALARQPAAAAVGGQPGGGRVESSSKTMLRHSDLVSDLTMDHLQTTLMSEFNVDFDTLERLLAGSGAVISGTVFVYAPLKACGLTAELDGAWRDTLSLNITIPNNEWRRLNPDTGAKITEITGFVPAKTVRGDKKDKYTEKMLFRPTGYAAAGVKGGKEITLTFLTGPVPGQRADPADDVTGEIVRKEALDFFGAAFHMREPDSGDNNRYIYLLDGEEDVMRRVSAKRVVRALQRKKLVYSVLSEWRKAISALFLYGATGFDVNDALEKVLEGFATCIAQFILSEKSPFASNGENGFSAMEDYLSYSMGHEIQEFHLSRGRSALDEYGDGGADVIRLEFTMRQQPFLARTTFMFDSESLPW